MAERFIDGKIPTGERPKIEGAFMVYGNRTALTRLAGQILEAVNRDGFGSGWVEVCAPLETLATTKCEQCRFWQRWPVAFEDGGYIGHCRRKSPTTRANEPHAEWPQTNPDDFCGEFQPKDI